MKDTMLQNFPSPTALTIKAEARKAENTENARRQAANFWQKFANEMIRAAENGFTCASGQFPVDVDPKVATEMLLSMNSDNNGNPQAFEYTISVDNVGAFLVRWGNNPSYVCKVENLPDSVF